MGLFILLIWAKKLSTLRPNLLLIWASFFFRLCHYILLIWANIICALGRFILFMANVLSLCSSRLCQIARINIFLENDEIEILAYILTTSGNCGFSVLRESVSCSNMIKKHSNCELSWQQFCKSQVDTHLVRSFFEGDHLARWYIWHITYQLTPWADTIEHLLKHVELFCRSRWRLSQPKW